MMQIILLLATGLGLAFGAGLDNSYLPPNNNLGAGGPLGGFSSAGASSRANGGKHIPVLKFAAENEGDGTYRYNYESANGINAEEQGDARGDGTKAHGSFSYTAPDGQHFSIAYTADENGFVPQGSHIPTPPPVPEAILKALQENAAAEARGIFDDGQYHGEGQNGGQYNGKNVISGSYASNGGYRY